MWKKLLLITKRSYNLHERGRGDKDIFTVARHLGFDMSGPEGRNLE